MNSRSLCYVVLLLLSFTLAGCDSAESHRVLLDRYVGIWNTGDFGNLQEVIHEEFELRMTPRFEAETGIDAFKEAVSAWRTAYPDFHVRVDEVVLSANAVAARWTITATNSGPGWHPPTGKKVTVPGMSMFHLVDGRIKDEWIAGNNGYWLHQLGYTLVPPEGIDNAEK
ncbi:MAG: ester cyclase [Ignavibacteria bacterium]|nr:ester cyclase [Ignavibacteria bacterium]